VLILPDTSCWIEFLRPRGIDLLRPFLPRRRRPPTYCDPPLSAASRASMARAPESELAIE
jgi:hypothetical protein